MANQPPNQIEQLQKALKLTQRLRSNVTQVFQKLSDGFEDVEKKDKYLLNDLHKTLSSVNTDLSDLEAGSSSLGPLTAASNSTNSTLICVDPIIDKTSTYTQLIHSYKWTDKMKEQASYANNLLKENPFKRTPIQSGTFAKRLRRSQPACCYPQSNVDILLNSLIHQYRDTMHISVVRPLGSSAVVLVVLGKTLKALLVLRGMVIEWVKVKGYTEDFHGEDGKVDIWSSSRYQVFQKITQHVTAATLHYYAPEMPEIAIKSLIIWLQSYSTLFSTPCQKCGQFLQNGLPPTWRDLRTKKAYHERCKLMEK
ncbi:mediator of RNA polymerase II transcription subunit 27 [Patella vulgata]|uniref:mediator of RNA polymerase II transcription subunit 27 n=1 Tax=Patella vulgata TaxID=6465 RepID=UPI00217F3E5B|nr:mediator of RNA polymerase II transcription subunit 27 [Patella vulgata]